MQTVWRQYVLCIAKYIQTQYILVMPTRSTKKRVPMVRTSVQLPQTLLDELESRWPTVPMSERIRLGLERHEFFMQMILKFTSSMIDKHIETVASALSEFDHVDFKVACRSMPSLIEAYLQEEDHPLTPEEAKSLTEWIAEADVRERLHFLDAAVNERDRVDDASPAEGEESGAHVSQQ
jgi:hypothetical protein